MSKKNTLKRLLLHNDLLEVEISPKNGSITGIRDRRTKKQYIKERKYGQLFRLMIPSSTWNGQHVNSWEQDVSKIEQPSNSSIVLHYDSLATSEKIFLVEASVIFRLENDNLAVNLLLNNRSSEEITDVIFPWVGGLGEISDPRTDAIYLPGQNVRRIESPLRTFARNHFEWFRGNLKFSHRYPGSWLGLATTWVDYSSKECGLGMDVRCNTFEPIDFYVEGLVEKDAEDSTKNRKALSFAWCFHPHIGSNEDWESPEVIIRAHLGDWHVVADEHRKWVETWIVKPEIPESFAKSLGWHFYFMKHQDGTVINTYDDLPRMAKSSLAAGIPYIMLFGWHKVGHDNYYPFGYFPNEDWGGEERLKQRLKEVKEMGCQPIPFFNCTLLDIQTEEFRRFGHAWPVKSRTGGYYFGGDWGRCLFDVPFATAAWHRGASSRSMLLVDLCPYCESIQWILETAKRIIAEYGFDNLQLDQIAHKSYCCYDLQHGHEKPQYAFSRGITAVLTEIRKTLREYTREGVVVGEGVSEFVGQYCDSHWTWWQLDYPEPLRYSIPWLTYSHEIDALEYGNVNKCFVYKIMIDLKIDGGDGYVSNYPKFCEHLRKLSLLKKHLDNVYTYAYFRDEEGINYPPCNSGVIAKVYKNPKNGRIGIVVANTAAEKKSVELTVKVNTSGKEYTVYRLDGSIRQIPRRQKVKLELLEYDIQVLAIE